MIYLVIADIKNTKGDCHDMWQPHNLLPTEVREYIENTKNNKTRVERYFAYSALSLSLKEFFSVDDFKIERNENGKPDLADSHIHISLSHCEKLVAVAISDLGEIGVDVQCHVDIERSERLETRFLKDLSFKNNELDIKYFLFEPDGNLKAIQPKTSYESDFLNKWTFAEANIKCRGLSFSQISEINRLSKTTLSSTVEYQNCKITTVIAK